jgi:hypothetical protein
MFSDYYLAMLTSGATDPADHSSYLLLTRLASAVSKSNSERWACAVVTIRTAANCPSLAPLKQLERGWIRLTAAVPPG